MQFFDAAPVTGTRRTREGYLVADVRIARAGNVQSYLGAEVGRPDMAVVRVFRPEEAVFDQAAMASFAFKPVTMDHPAGFVTADNWKEHAVGLTGGEIARDGSFLRVPMVLMDGASIEDVEGGKREVSCGYAVALDHTPGTTPTGEAFDARVTSIVGNHLAVVPKGRAGSECRIGDAAAANVALDSTAVIAALARKYATTPSNNQGGRPVADEIRTVVMDGHSIPVTAQGQEALNRLLADRDAARQRDVATVEQRLRDAEAAARTEAEGLRGQIAALTQGHTTALQAKDGEIAGLKAAHDAAIQAKDGEIVALQAQVTDEALEARASARAALVASARRILGDAYNPAGRSDADVRKDVVLKALGANLGDAATRPPEFFTAAFDVVMAQQPKAPVGVSRPDPLATALSNGAGTTQPVGDAAQMTPYQQNVEHLRNAWKTAGAAGPAGR